MISLLGILILFVNNIELGVTIWGGYMREICGKALIQRFVVRSVVETISHLLLSSKERAGDLDHLTLALNRLCTNPQTGTSSRILMNLCDFLRHDQLLLMDFGKKFLQRAHKRVADGIRGTLSLQDLVYSCVFCSTTCVQN